MDIVPVTVNCAAIRVADLAAIDRLAGIALIVRVNGGDVQLVNVSAELRELIALCGLGEALRVEVERQPEERKQSLGVEEERDVLDPPA